VSLTYHAYSDAGFGSADERAWRYLFVERTHGGRHPVVVIPYEVDPKVLVYGLPSNPTAFSHDWPRREMSIDVTEFPIPGLGTTFDRPGTP